MSVYTWEMRMLKSVLWMAAGWALLILLVGAVMLAAGSVVRRALVETQEAYDLDTGANYGRVTVSGTVELPAHRKNARVGFRPVGHRPGLLSSARTELRLDVSCEGANREVLEVTATLAYLWQTGTIEQVLEAIAEFPEKKTGCTVSMHPSRWTATP